MSSAPARRPPLRRLVWASLLLLVPPLRSQPPGWPPPDLTLPAVTDEAPAPGRRVRLALPSRPGTALRHLLYLPTDWQPATPASGPRHPVIAEFPGNGPFRSPQGDTSSGQPEGCMLGYGIGGGKRFLWISLPFLDSSATRHQTTWWGDAAATAAYAREAVLDACARFGGDTNAVILAGFSRGSIAGNAIGLHDDTTAALWRAFVCHSHYDGVREWNHPDLTRAAALARLPRLAGRPQFISMEGSTAPIRAHLATHAPAGRFTFVDLPFPNHTAAWVLHDLPARRDLRAWVDRVLGN